jgi:hypothetical protein
MKRASASSMIQRKTRSITRRLNHEAERKQREERDRQVAHERAVSLMETPQLQALPLVLVKSGFLRKHECLNAAVTCKDWCAIWKEVEDELPEANQVEIHLAFDRKKIPCWAEDEGLDTVLGTQEFVRQVFDKVNALKVDAKRSKKKQDEARSALPKWGVDFHYADVFVWGPNSHNNGGIHISLKKHFIGNFAGREALPQEVVFALQRSWNGIGWTVRLDTNLVLWTGIRSWRVYDWSPLWP